MAEYIDREALNELVEILDKNERCKNCYHLNSCDAWVRNATRLYDDYSYSVENCPYYIAQADVVEVRHGEWIGEIVKRNDWRGKEQSYYQPNSCSLCHTGLAVRTNFCPNCGAKMKGKVEDNESNN